MDRLTITELRKEIEQRREEQMTDEQFKLLLSGFAAYIDKKGYYTAGSTRNAIHRGWMSAKMAHFFKQYASQ